MSKTSEATLNRFKGVDIKDITQTIGVDEMIDILGAEEVAKGGVRIGSKQNGYKRYEFKNLAANRKLKMHIAQRWASEMVRGKWDANGETMKRDRKGMLHDGQHRGVGLLLAEAMRQADPEHYATHYGVKGPIKIDVVFIDGVNSKAMKTIGVGVPQSHGDILYRSGDMEETDYFSRDQLVKELGSAGRLVWLTTGGKVVSDAPKLPFTELEDFLYRHPQLRAAVYKITDIDTIEIDGDATESGEAEVISYRIRQYLSIAYAAGLLYMMATCESDPDNAFLGEGGAENEDGLSLDYSNWDKAVEFFEKLASGESMKTGDPVLALSKALVKGNLSRNDKVSLVIKAWNAYVSGTKVNKLTLTKADKDRDTRPRIGGLDNPVTKDES